MRILAINCGSSSIKAALIDSADSARLSDVEVENIGTAECRMIVNGAPPESMAVADHAAGVSQALDAILQRATTLGEPEAVVHRIVHGGDQFVAPTLVTDAVLSRIDALDGLAPLHNPPAVAALRVARSVLPSIAHVAVFDTAFHATLPPQAREYALPAEVRQRFGIRRYGFHGISHAHVMAAVAGYLRKTPQELRVISCHLGNGASVAAIECGRSVDTSMGMTPLAGLIMGTRCGDLDPGILLLLLQSGAYDTEQLTTLLNQASGLQGLTGTNDLRAIEQRAAAGEESCRRAIDAYAHRVRHYIGAYAAVMGGVDAIAFTGGIGEHSALMRSRILQRLDFLGACLEEDRNREARVGHTQPIALLSAEQSRVAMFVVQADEAAAMVRAAAKLIG
jgi:acetate kinase